MSQRKTCRSYGAERISIAKAINILLLREQKPNDQSLPTRHPAIQ